MLLTGVRRPTVAGAREAAHRLGRAVALPAEDVDLWSCTERILADDVGIDATHPPFDCSAMDGWAVRAADTARASDEDPVLLRITAEARAGAPSRETLVAGLCAPISTGARMPDGADAVIRLEDARADEGALRVSAPVGVGRDVRRAGEDLEPGLHTVPAGTRLHPGDVAVLAAAGLDRVRCVRRPTARIVVTGDEVAAPGGRVRDAIVPDITGPAIASLLSLAGFDVVAPLYVPDDPDRTIAALTSGSVDLVVTSGGASVGAHDHVRRALHDLRAEPAMDGIAMRPGGPAWMGTIRDATGAPTIVLSLPGNPGAAVTVAALLLDPLARGLAGRPPAPVRYAVVADRLNPAPAHDRALRVAVDADEHGCATALVLPGQQSHRVASLPTTDGFLLVPAGCPPITAGSSAQLVLVGAG